MQTPDNLFKQALARGQAQIGLWQALADPYAAEICAGSGFDWQLLTGSTRPTTCAACWPPCKAWHRIPPIRWYGCRMATQR